MNNKTTTLAMSVMLPLLALAPGAASAVDDDSYALINGEPLTKEFVELVVPSGVPNEQLRQMVEVMARNMIVAQEAEKSGLLESGELQAELQVARLQVLVRAYVRDFLDRNSVDDARVSDRYEELKSLRQADGAHEYNASHILVESEDEAAEIISQIGGDADQFAQVARDRSTDTGSGAQGGNLGWAPAQTYVPEFAAAIQDMEPGDFSDEPVQTQFGWHVIHLLDRREAQFPELDETIRQQISEQIQAELIEEEFARLVENSEVEYSDDLN